MSEVIRAEQTQAELVFVGHAWQDSYIDKKDGTTKQRVSIALDQGIKQFVWNAGDRLTLFENKQREGKKDAQWRVVLSPAAKATK